jgi:plastocyanin
MSRLGRKLLCGLACAAVIAVQAPAGAVAPERAASADRADSVPLFAGGGTALSNGYFFPGTAVYDNGEFTGVPLQIQQGQNIEFVNTDVAAVTNGHAIVSMKRKHGRPLFQSGLVNGPATTTVITQKLKPGVYPYFCSIHYGMYGLIEVTTP